MTSSGLIVSLAAYKYIIDLLTTIVASFLSSQLGGEERTTTKSGLIAVIMMNLNISLLFIQYFDDFERIKFVRIVVWAIFIIALIAAYKLGKGGFETSTGAAPGIVRRIGSPLFSGIIVLVLYLIVDYGFEFLRPVLRMV